MSMKQRATVATGTSELSEDEVVSTSSIQLNEELVMLMMARRRATKCTVRRGGRGRLPLVSGDLPRGRSVGHTHTLEKEGGGTPSLSGIDRQRQPGGAPAQAGAQEGGPAEHGQARGGDLTRPGAAPKEEEGGISRSPTSSQQQVLLTQAHRMPDSPSQQQQPSPRQPAKAEEVVARAVAVVLSGGGFGTACEDDGRRRLENAAPPAAAALLLAHLGTVVGPEGGGAKPPPPSPTVWYFMIDSRPSGDGMLTEQQEVAEREFDWCWCGWV